MGAELSPGKAASPCAPSSIGKHLPEGRARIAASHSTLIPSSRLRMPATELINAGRGHRESGGGGPARSSRTGGGRWGRARSLRGRWVALGAAPSPRLPGSGCPRLRRAPPPPLTPPPHSAGGAAAAAGAPRGIGAAPPARQPRAASGSERDPAPPPAAAALSPAARRGRILSLPPGAA
ncbi:actin nucleation-promoting factor WAS-like [Melozone crissalis]|uniref:actin nucleation-promoting factor WAS-like n=1 Tax=Melozone crissalis TaxID=40204 RepID=UPI0023DC7F92|nr:actin nucleation-promoting factor WAS-like [Melozone crissalis]